jgi:hypothetical protein
MPVVSCPKCATRLKVDELDPGDRIECTRCGKQFVLPQEEPVHRGKKVQQAGGCAGVGCFLLVALACGFGWLGWSQVKQKALDDLAAGDRLYADNKKAEAIAKYKSAYSFTPDARKAQLVGRIADHEATAGNTAEARRWITTGLDVKLNVSYESAEAKALHTQVQRERAEAQAKKAAEKEAKEKAERDAEEKRKRYGGSAEATTAAQMLVKRQLAFPEEARFSILGRDTLQSEDGSWKVSGEVASKNAFGVKVKFRFQVTVLRLATGDWQEVEPVLLSETG